MHAHLFPVIWKRLLPLGVWCTNLVCPDPMIWLVGYDLPLYEGGLTKLTLNYETDKEDQEDVRDKMRRSLEWSTQI